MQYACSEQDPTNTRAKNMGKVVIKVGQRKRKSETGRQFFVKFYSIKFHKDPFSSSLMYAYGRTDKNCSFNSRFTRLKNT